MLEFKKAGSCYQINGVETMSHEYRILERMLIEGQISRQEFKERIDAEYGKLEQELMNDEITPDQHVERYNELMQMEPQSFGAPVLHEHI